jgi:hypothetical protein
MSVILQTAFAAETILALKLLFTVKIQRSLIAYWTCADEDFPKQMCSFENIIKRKGIKVPYF